MGVVEREDKDNGTEVVAEVAEVPRFGTGCSFCQAIHWRRKSHNPR